MIVSSNRRHREHKESFALVESVEGIVYMFLAKPQCREVRKGLRTGRWLCFADSIWRSFLCELNFKVPVSLAL